MPVESCTTAAICNYKRTRVLRGCALRRSRIVAVLPKLFETQCAEKQLVKGLQDASIRQRPKRTGRHGTTPSGSTATRRPLVDPQGALCGIIAIVLCTFFGRNNCFPCRLPGGIVFVVNDYLSVDRHLRNEKAVVVWHGSLSCFYR